MNLQGLTVEMKSTLGLIVSLIVFLIVGGAPALASAPVDNYALLSFMFIIPYIAFFLFGRKRKAWAYLGSVILSALLISAIPLSFGPRTTDLVLWELTFSTILLALISLEAFKSYLQLRGS